MNKYLARVVDNQDEKQLGRIKIVCPDFTGSQEPFDEWVEPLLDWGWFYIPDVDEIVEIEILMSSGQDEVPFESAIYNPVMKWRGKRTSGEDSDSPRPVPAEMKTNYGKRRGFVTPSGHVLLFDDTPGSSRVRIGWKDGSDSSEILLDESGSIAITNKAGTTIVMDADSNTVTVVADVVDIQADSVKLGNGADTPAVRGDDWKSWAEAHTHPSGTGPTGAPIQPIPPSVLSTVVELK
jgi:hypothetical protein